MKYLVEIIPESITDLEATTSRLAAALKLEPAKAAALLKRNPVTKPVSQAEAEKVARLFSKAGIEVFIREEVLTTEVAPVIPARADTLIQQIHQSEQIQETGQATVQPTPLQDMSESVTLEPTLEQPIQRESPPPLAAQEPEFTDPGLGAARATELPKAPSVVPETHQVLSLIPPHEPSSHDDPFQTKSVQGSEPVTIPSGFFTPVPEGSVTSHSERSSPELPAFEVEESVPPSSASSGLGKMMFASIVPGLLALAGILTALYLLGLPFLQSQQRTSAETTAVSLASSIGSWIGDVSLDNPALAQQIQNVVARTQSDLRGRGIDLVLLSDTEGNQLAGWYKDGQGVPDTVAGATSIKTQISNALASTTTPDDPAARLSIDNEVLGLAAATVQQGNTPVGALIVGTSEQSLMAKLRPLLTPIVLAGVLPLVLGILVSLLIGRNRR
jgi:hypothetical protein